MPSTATLRSHSACLSWPRAVALNDRIPGPEAKDIVDGIVSTIVGNWRDAAHAAGLSEADRSMLWKRSILNGSVFYE